VDAAARTSLRAPDWRALITSLRPRHWTKNVLLFAGIVFARQLTDQRLLVLSLAGFVVFCLLSSAVYIINDLADLTRDREHPIKRLRPLAAGRISPAAARRMAAALVVVCLYAAFTLGPPFGFAASTYLALQLSYSLLLKDVVIVDVLTIAAGFVLRAAAGAAVVSVVMSPWLLATTGFGALFQGFAKRRHELGLLAGGARSHRPSLGHYTVHLLDHFILTAAALVIITYTLYTMLNPDKVPAGMMLTVPLVVYGIFRYLYLIYVHGEGGSPEELLLSDKPLLSVILLWGLVVVALLYVP
jgi:4-hydroxybenzoate polyprenyltransferase